MRSLNEHREEQRHMCERFKVPFDLPMPHTKVGFAVNEGRVPIYGVRHLPVGDTNGWYIWSGERSNARDFFQPLHTEHLLKRCPLVLPLLALPPGYGFVTDDKGYIDVWFDQAFLVP